MEGIETAVPSIHLTHNLLRYIDDAISKTSDRQTEIELKHYSSAKEGSPVPFHVVRRAFLTLKEAGDDVYLHEMISNSDLVLPEVKFPPRNPELEARIEKLKAAEHERIYRRMTDNVDPARQSKKQFTFQEDVKSMNKQMIAVFNFLVTVGGAFAFGYKAIELAAGTQMFAARIRDFCSIVKMVVLHVGQVVFGLLLATIVFFADLYFLLKYNT